MTEMRCECAQQQPVDNSPPAEPSPQVSLVDNFSEPKIEKSSDHAMSLVSHKDKSLFETGRAREAPAITKLRSRLDILEAEFEALAFRIDEILSLIDGPLTGDQLLARLRALKASLNDAD